MPWGTFLTVIAQASIILILGFVAAAVVAGIRESVRSHNKEK